MFKKILFGGILLLGIYSMMSSVFALDITKKNTKYISNFSQKGLFMVSSDGQTIGTNYIIPKANSYGWEIKNTWGMKGVSKRQYFIDIGVNIDINTKKMILIDEKGNLTTSAFNKSHNIDYEYTFILKNKDVIGKLIAKDYSVGYICKYDKDSEGNMQCAGLFNSVGFFKTAPYAIENNADGVLNGGVEKIEGVKISTTDFVNKVQYGVKKYYSKDNNVSYVRLVKYVPANKITISSAPLYTYSMKSNVNLTDVKGFIATNNNDKITFYGNEVVGLFRIGLDSNGFITLKELISGKGNTFITAVNKESLYQKTIDGKINYYIGGLVNNGVMQTLDYTNARTINREFTYGLLNEQNKAILVNGMVDSVKAINMSSILGAIGNGFTSKAGGTVILSLAKGFSSFKPQFIQIVAWNGTEVNYISTLGVQNLNTDDKLKVISYTPNLDLSSQAGLKYGAIRDGKVGYYKIAQYWYKIGQYVDNGQIVSKPIYKSGDKYINADVYSPLYAYSIRNVNANILDFKGFIGLVNNPYIYTHGELSKFEPVGTFNDKTLTLQDIFTYNNTDVGISPNTDYIVNLSAGGKLQRYIASNLKRIDYQLTKVNTAYSGYNINKLTAGQGGAVYTLMLSGDKLYGNEYNPDIDTLINNSWTQITSGSNYIRYIQNENGTLNLIDADGLYWKK